MFQCSDGLSHSEHSEGTVDVSKSDFADVFFALLNNSSDSSSYRPQNELC